MNTILTLLIGLAIGGWFLYCLYRMLRGARGNSGVILSLLFRGISKELKGC